MEIIKGNYSGFCAGVNFTYSKAKEELKKGPLYCLGDIIHNEIVINELESLGMITVNSIMDIPDNSRVIFRAHGERPDSYEYAKLHNLEVIDLTCANVKLIHNKVLKNNDKFIILIGKHNHPEVIGTSGYCINYYVVENEDDLKDAYQAYIKSKLSNIYIISQTTFSSSKFDILVESIKSLFNNSNIIIDKTICASTEKRQEEVIDLSKKCNKMLVIGSKNSSNTKELYNLSNKYCNNTYFVENENDLDNIEFSDKDKVGVVAGASVPLYIIDTIINKIKNV